MVFQEQFAWLVNLQSTDQLLSAAYEYMAAQLELAKGDCTDDTQLHAQRLVCEFGSAFFKTLLECSREGEQPLQVSTIDLLTVLLLLLTHFDRTSKVRTV